MSETEESTRRSDGIQVISRAANVLRSLRDRPEGLSLGQIAERTGLSRSTVQRIVGALVGEGLLMPASPTGGVRIGPEIVALAAHARIDVVEVARDHLKEFAETTGETINLSVLRQNRVVFLDQIVGTHPLRTTFLVGEALPLHCTSNGKACLMLLEDSRARQLLRGELERCTPNSICDADTIMAQVQTARRTHLAYNYEEHCIGICGIGTAFQDKAGTIYALSSPSPVQRFTAKQQELETAILAARDKVMRALGTR